MEANNTRKHNSYLVYLFLTIVFILTTTVIGVMLFRIYIAQFTWERDANRYEQYYVMITGDKNSSLWQSVYQGAYEAGLEQNIYVDLLDEVFSNQYSREDLMQIAIASKVDGIIVAADESDEITNLINEAVEEGIPVVTLYGDNTQSSRCSFVGIGGYDLGREYGRQVLHIEKERRVSSAVTLEPSSDGKTVMHLTQAQERQPLRVMVLVNAYAQDTGQNIIYSGMQETIENEKDKDMEIEMSFFSVDDTNAFSVEESIRDIFMEGELPDIIVCLNELNTTCVYQAVVDYNKVGQVNIIGYYDSNTIMNAIDRNVIYATVSIDTMQMGRFCVEALTEYYTYGNTSQYFTADITLINKDNVARYLRGDVADEE